MEKQRDQSTRTESKTRFVGQINLCLRSGDYSRALDLLQGAPAEFRNDNDAELAELEKLAHEGVKRGAEANRLITQSQDLFAQQKSADAIQLLREAYELDRHNSLARAILANALVEHAHSMVDTDWREAEKLAKQALEVNPSHPTAKTIRGLVLDRKKTSSVDDWVAQARKLQASGDLFAALAWVEEGMAFHPDDPKLTQIQDAIQRDQAAQRRQSRRRDLESLRRMESEIDAVTDLAAKQVIADRIQGVAAKYWTDGEFLTVANGLLQRLGLAPQQSSSASPQSKGSTVIFHVPRPTPAKPLEADTRPNPISAVQAGNVPEPVITLGKASADQVHKDQIPPSSSSIPDAPKRLPEPQILPPLAPNVYEPSATAQAKRPIRSTASALIFVSTAAVVLVATTFFFTRKHYAPPEAKIPAVNPTISAPAASVPPSTSIGSAPVASAPVQTTSEPSLPASPVSSEGPSGKVAPASQPGIESVQNVGALLIVAGQNDAKVFLDGKLQPQLTQAGQLRLPNLETKEYVVQVSKAGFQDPSEQKIRIRKGEQAKLVFNLQPQNQPQPRVASLIIQGGAPGTTVLIDQVLTGSVQSDGTLAVSTVSPGDHTVELRKEGFKSRQFKEHFVVGGKISLAAADAALEAAPGELRIVFTPADSTVAIAKGDLLKMVSSGAPFNLAPGTYTLTARTAERFTRSSPLEVIAGQSKTLNLSLAPNGMSRWEDPGAWKREGDSFVRKGGDFVLYGVVPASGTFAFSAMLVKGRLLQWVFNYSDPRNYVLFQMDENNFYRTVIRNGEKSDQIIVPDRGDKKSFRTLQIRVSPAELVHQIKQGDRWTVLDRWAQPGVNLSAGKFGFYIPGNDQVALSSFAHYVDLNIR